MVSKKNVFSHIGTYGDLSLVINCADKKNPLRAVTQIKGRFTVSDIYTCFFAYCLLECYGLFCLSSSSSLFSSVSLETT